MTAERYLREVWPVVTKALKEAGIGCELNLVSFCRRCILLTVIYFEVTHCLDYERQMQMKSCRLSSPGPWCEGRPFFVNNDPPEKGMSLHRWRVP